LKDSHFLALFEKAQREHIPLEVSIELTHRCNFRCIHCYIPDFSAPDLLSTRRILDLLDELVEMGTLYLTFTGGEVFLRKDWRVVFRAARERGFQITILSNGFLIDDEVADEIAALHALVEISYYASRPELFDAITGKTGSFEVVTRAIERLHRRGVQLQLKTPVMRINHAEVKGIRDFADRLEIQFQAFAKILPRKDGHPGPLQERMDSAALRQFVEGPHSGCFLPGEENTGAAPADSALCAAACRFAAISSNGDVLACNIMPGVAGNMLEKSFSEIWKNSPWFDRLRGIRRSDLEICDRCPSWGICGRCPAQALLEDGNLLGPAKDSCRYAEALLSIRESE